MVYGVDCVRLFERCGLIAVNITAADHQRRATRRNCRRYDVQGTQGIDQVELFYLPGGRAAQTSQMVKFGRPMHRKEAFDRLVVGNIQRDDQVKVVRNNVGFERSTNDPAAWP